MSVIQRRELMMREIGDMQEYGEVAIAEANNTFTNKVAEAAEAARNKNNFKLRSGGSTNKYNKQNSL